jgi:uncharacterized membrane protein YdjX (TVP38/TMEM64 family)
LWKYWAGTGVGIVPKIVLVVALGSLAPDQHSFSDGIKGILEFFLSREPRDLALLAAIVGGWLGFLLFVRSIYKWLRRRDGGGQ